MPLANGSGVFIPSCLGVPGFLHPIFGGTAVPDTYAVGAIVRESSQGGLYLKTPHSYDVSAAVTALGIDPATLPNLGITPWVRIGGDDDGWPVPGPDVGGNGSVALSCIPGKNAALSDLMAFEGSGNGLYWNYNNTSTDGAQEVWAQVGASGAKAWKISAADGSFGAPPGGIKFPTADPHIAGAWWDNAGVLTKSLG